MELYKDHGESISKILENIIRGTQDIKVSPRIFINCRNKTNYVMIYCINKPISFHFSKRWKL